jgi:hypothetical protein
VWFFCNYAGLFQAVLMAVAGRFRWHFAGHIARLEERSGLSADADSWFNVYGFTTDW